VKLLEKLTLRLQQAFCANGLCPHWGDTGIKAPADITTEGPFTLDEAGQFANVVYFLGWAIAAWVKSPLIPEVLARPRERDGRWYVDLAWR
jgi:hypothetical protein